MPKPISRQNVTARAEQVLNQRREAVSALADTQSAVDDLTAAFARELEDLRAAQATRLKDAAAANTRAWASAISAGWSEEDLRHFGFTEPEVKTRTRRTRRARSATSASTSTHPTASPTVNLKKTPEVSPTTGAPASEGAGTSAASTPSPVVPPGAPAVTS